MRIADFDNSCCCLLIRNAHSPFRNVHWLKAQWTRLPHIVCNRFQVLFHSPNRGSFHLSLALLFTIGHQVVLSLARWAALIHARFHETGATREFRWSPNAFVYRAVTFFGQAFQPVPLASSLLTPCHLRNGGRSSHYPIRATLTGLTHAWFGLVPFRSPLLGESMSLSFPAATEMGQFSAFPAAGYGFTNRSRGAPSCRFRISDTPGSTPACGSPRLFAA